LFGKTKAFGISGLLRRNRCPEAEKSFMRELGGSRRQELGALD
jgi:hypothetical protein